MNIKNSIAKWVLGGYSYIGKSNGKTYINDFSEIRHEFAQVLFMNIVELITELTNDVTFTLLRGDQMRFAEFKLFFEIYGQEALNKLFNKGFAVIAYKESGFDLLEYDDYTTDSKNKVLITNPNFAKAEIYVLKSDTFRMNGKSDRQFLGGFLTYLDNVMNASNTTTARLGSLIMASPKQASSLPVMATLEKSEKDDIEKEISEEYGGLKKQKQILIWKQSMEFTTINLAGLDRETINKAKFAVTAICDRLKIPANQVALIDATTSSNSLSNGGQYREGDLLKYKTFERLLNKTFVRMATELDLIVDYAIYNKPQSDEKAIGTDQSTPEKQIEQIVSLNGAQISSLLEILASVSGGLIDKNAAINIIISAFPQIAESDARKILEGVKIGVSEAVNAPTN